MLSLASTARSYAASITLTGSAKVANTSSYLDLDSYNSNVSVDDATGSFSGYAWLEDAGWVAFGTADNSEGPVIVNLTTGTVSGKAKVLNTNAYLDFTNYESNVTVSLTSGVFSGYVWSEDVGWIDFSDTGVSSSSPLVAPTSTPTSGPTSTPGPNPTLPPLIQNRLDNGYDANGECVMQKPGGKPEIFKIEMSDTSATLYIAPPTKPYTTFFITYKEVGNVARENSPSLGSKLSALGSLLEHPVYADSPEYAIDFSHTDDGGVVVYTVNDLKPNTRYSFTIKCANKCAFSETGNTLGASTNIKGSSTIKTYLASNTIPKDTGLNPISALVTTGVPAIHPVLVGLTLLTTGVGVYTRKRRARRLHLRS